MINRNIQKVFKDYLLEYNICIVGDMLYIVNDNEKIQSEVEVPFDSIECFKRNPDALTKRMKWYVYQRYFIQFYQVIVHNHIKVWNMEMFQQKLKLVQKHMT